MPGGSHLGNDGRTVSEHTWEQLHRRLKAVGIEWGLLNTFRYHGEIKGDKELERRDFMWLLAGL